MAHVPSLPETLLEDTQEYENSEPFLTPFKKRRSRKIRGGAARKPIQIVKRQSFDNYFPKAIGDPRQYNEQGEPTVEKTFAQCTRTWRSIEQLPKQNTWSPVETTMAQRCKLCSRPSRTTALICEATSDACGNTKKRKTPNFRRNTKPSARRGQRNRRFDLSGFGTRSRRCGKRRLSKPSLSASREAPSRDVNMILRVAKFFFQH